MTEPLPFQARAKDAGSMNRPDGVTDRDWEMYQRRLAGETLLEAGTPYGVSRERVRHIEAEVERKMQSPRWLHVYDPPHAPPDPIRCLGVTVNGSRCMRHATRDGYCHIHETQRGGE